MHNIHSNTYCTVQQDFTSVLSCSTMYSKLNRLFGYFYSVVLTIQRSKTAFTNDAFCQWSNILEVLDCFVVRQWLVWACSRWTGVGSRRAISSRLAASRKMTLREGHSSALKIDYNTKDNGGEFVCRVKVRTTSVCRHAGAEKGNMSRGDSGR